MSLLRKIVLASKKPGTVLLALSVILCLVAAPFMSQSSMPPAGSGGGATHVLQSRAPLGEGSEVPTFGAFVGSNSFFNENQATYEIFGNIREYHPFGFTEWTAGWYEDSNGITNSSLMGPNPQAVFMNTWNVFDNYYKTMFDKGIELTLCLTGTADDRERPDYQDADGTGSENPASYLGHAQSMFQLAARYGGNKNVDPNLVRVAAGTEKKVGLGYVKYFENTNEPNLHGFTGAQFAAMMSADYDGHMGTLGPDAGVKKADPSAKVVMGGIAGVMFNDTGYGNTEPADLAFFEEMKAWFDANRTLEQWKAANGGSEEGYEKYPFDVVSCHAYSSDAYYHVPPNPMNASGVSPEDSHYYEVFKKYGDASRALFPGKEVYLSEFGWDTNNNGYSIFRVTINDKVNTGLNGMEVQGRWLVREYLMMAAAGIDRARQFMIPDTSDNPNDPNWFATSGLVHGIQGSTNYKPSWYYIGTMNNVLKGASMNNIEVIADGGFAAKGVENAGPWALKFSPADGGTDQIYALWLPTSLGDLGGANALNYTINVPRGYSVATLVEMKDKVRWGERTDISSRISGGAVTVRISEKPVFVILSEGEYYNPVYDFIHPRNFTAFALTQNSGNPAMLFEEQRTDINTSPAPSMSNAWSPGGMHRYAAIDLGAKYSLSNIFVWDREGALAAGKVLAVYAYSGGGDPGLQAGGMTGGQVQSMLAGSGWRRVAWYDLAGWETWSEAVVDVETQYLVLGFEDGPSEFYDNPWPADWLVVPEMVIKGALARTEPTQPPTTVPPTTVPPTTVPPTTVPPTTVPPTTVPPTTVPPTTVPPTTVPPTTVPPTTVPPTTVPPTTVPPTTVPPTTVPPTTVPPTTVPPTTVPPTTVPPTTVPPTTVPPTTVPPTTVPPTTVPPTTVPPTTVPPTTVPPTTTPPTTEPPTSGLILNATFDSLPLGRFKDGDEELTVLDRYVQDCEIVQPVPSDLFFLGNADKMLKVSTFEDLFDTDAKSVVSQYEIGKDYVFEMSFFATTANTTPFLSFRYGQWAWEYEYFTLTDWHGDMVAYGDDGSETHIKPEPNRWHRYAVKYRFETATDLTFSFYYDNKLISTGSRDAVVRYGTKDLIGKLGFNIALWRVGGDIKNNPLYINDALIYSGDIRPWPAKYAGG